MATNLISMANKLKLMVEQVKVQSEAFKDNAVTQAKIQAENEKAEVIFSIIFYLKHSSLKCFST